MFVLFCPHVILFDWLAGINDWFQLKFLHKADLFSYCHCNLIVNTFVFFIFVFCFVSWLQNIGWFTKSYLLWNVGHTHRSKYAKKKNGKWQSILNKKDEFYLRFQEKWEQWAISLANKIPSNDRDIARVDRFESKGM